MAISVQQLHQIIDYNSDTGEFTWRERKEDFPSSISAIKAFNKVHAGNLVYQDPHKGYHRMELLGRRYRSHRVAWAMHYGDWPSNNIDHINGTKTDNRISNLRVVAQLENARNARRPAHNMSGVVGVSWDKYNFKWVAEIGVNHKTVRLGRFKDFDDAVKARKEAEINYNFHTNHGRGEASVASEEDVL
jgi:hypothetical protein